MNLSFSRWNSGYQEAFSHELFLFHDGILAIKEPFHTNFFFFTMEVWLSRSLSHKLFFFTMEVWLSGSLFIRTFSFSRWNSQNARFGEDSFHIYIYLYIYITKSIYIGSALLKTLPLDLEPPLQGKEYGPPYSNATKKKKAIVFCRNHL
jgi:hypothetical protein